MDKTVRGRARRERGNMRGGATKKREISRNPLSINLHFSVHTNLRSIAIRTGYRNELGTEYFLDESFILSWTTDTVP